MECVGDPDARLKSRPRWVDVPPVARRVGLEYLIVNPRTAPHPAARSLRARFSLLGIGVGLGLLSALVPIDVRPAGAGMESEAANEGGRIVRVQSTGPQTWLVDGALFGYDNVNLPVGDSAPISLRLPEGLVAQTLSGVQRTGQSSNGNSGVRIGISGEPQTITVAGSSSPSGADPGAVTLPLPSGHVDAVGTASYALEATSTDTSAGEGCLVLAPLVLEDVAVSVKGTLVQPGTFAEFFPAVLDRFVIRMERADGADALMAQSILDLAGFAARKWPQAQVVVTDRAIELTPFDRVVTFRPWVAAGLTLDAGPDGATLVVGGSSDETARLISYVTSPQFEASFRSRANPAVVPVAIQPHASYLTVAELRGGGVSASGVGAAGITLDVDQSMLGGQMESIYAKVTGVARTKSARSVTVQLRANDRILATQRVGSDELFSLAGSIGTPSLLATNEFEVRVMETNLADQSGATTAGSAADSDSLAASVPTEPGSEAPETCGAGAAPTAKIKLELDPTSSFEGTRGVGVSTGFDRFPQAFARGFDIRFENPTFDDLVGAAAMVELLQQQTKQPLPAVVRVGKPEVENFDRPTLFVAATGSAAVSLAGLGVANGEATETVPVDSETVGSDTVPGRSTPPTTAPAASVNDALKGGSAALTAVERGSYDHLLLAANSSEDIKRLLAPTRSASKGLRSLSGDLLVESGGRVKNVRINATSYVRIDRPNLEYRTRSGFPMLLGFVVGSIVAVGVVITRRWRRS